MNKHRSTPIDFKEVLDDMEDEDQNPFNLNEKIENLKIELKNQQKSMTVAEYNKKRVIFEYLTRLDQGKHKKTIRLIDDGNIAEKCHIWIHSQGETTTSQKFKEFVENKLLVDSGVMRKKPLV